MVAVVVIPDGRTPNSDAGHGHGRRHQNGQQHLVAHGGGSQGSLGGRISAAGLPGPIAHVDRLATQLFKRGMRQNLSKLKRIIEAA
jgi:hypothetical protein